MSLAVIPTGPTRSRWRWVRVKRLDRSRYDNRSDQWRRRTGAKLRRARQLAGVPKRLVLVTVAALAALITQFVLQHSDRLPETNLSNWIGQTTAPIAGVASVIDGDTIQIRGHLIRFSGIDAPESQQYCHDAKGFEYACGRRSAEALDGFLSSSKPVQCTFVSWDRVGRYVGRCARADGSDVAGWQVENGQALDWPRYSHGAYAGLQAYAQAAKLGLWAGTFQKPWDWRAQHTATKQQTSAPVFALGNSGCNIKGNISADGERIYHLPGQKFYTVTKISKARGEKWFCSEAEARAAGWRRSKR